MEPPVNFPARVNGQQSMVNLSPTHLKWHPVPTEFSAIPIDGGSIPIVDIVGIDVQELGANKVLRVTADGVVTRVHAAAELVDRIVARLRRAG